MCVRDKGAPRTLLYFIVCDGRVFRGDGRDSQRVSRADADVLYRRDRLQRAELCGRIQVHSAGRRESSRKK